MSARMLVLTIWLVLFYSLFSCCMGRLISYSDDVVVVVDDDFDDDDTDNGDKVE